MARVLVLTAIAAVVVFAIVQDRITAAGARRYVDVYRSAPVVDAIRPGIDEVMRPAIRESVTKALLWSGGVAAGGMALAVVSARRARRE